MAKLLYWAIFPCGQQLRVDIQWTFVFPRHGPVLDGCCPTHGPDCRSPSFAEALMGPKVKVDTTIQPAK